MFVVKYAAGYVKHDMIGFNDEEEAVKFCDERNWTYLDPNCFEWDLVIDEEPGDANEVYIVSEQYRDND